MKRFFYFFKLSFCSLIVYFSILSSVSAQAFITTWKTDNPGTSNATSITIPTFNGETYNYDVDWDNDGIFDEFGITGDVTHDYGVSGEVMISIQGAFPRIYFNNDGDKEKIMSIEQWGNTAWTSMESAFYGATNLTHNASDVPDLTSVTDMARMFAGASSFNGDLSAWDVSSVMDMSRLFWNASSFNGDISGWDVSSVTNIGQMFANASSFNGDISAWDVSNVVQMFSVFTNASSFNGDISTWDVSSVVNMTQMFTNASSFDGDISTWDISNVDYMSSMLNNAGLSVSNYDNTLISWESQGVSNLTLGSNGLIYCNSEVARNSLINTYGWTITGDSQDCPPSPNCDIFSPLCAGDTNHDNVVDYNDLFTLGVKHGKMGCPRPNAHTDWIPQPAPDWGDIDFDGIDAKHADCNGDGLVDNSDDSPIVEAHYGFTHDGDDVYILENFTGDAIVQSHWRNPSTAPSTIELDIHLEELVGADIDLYGIGFTLDFSEAGINPSLSVINSVMGQEGQDLHTFSKDLGNGKMDVALTRLDGTPITTSPTNDYLGTITFEVNGDSDKNEFHLRFHNIKIINEVGVEVEPILGSSASAVFGIGSSFNATSPMFIHGAYIEDCNQGTIAKVIPSGGTAPYTYQWSNGSTTQQTDIFTVGIHRITITDANNISTIGRVRIYGDCQVILPLEWLDFSVRAQASNIVLDWTTANEVDIEKYDIQRSTDGIHFQSIATISSKNNHQNKYQWIDKTAQFNTLYYYQIKTIETNGKSDLSSIQSAQLAQGLTTISIQPNPTKDKVTLFLKEPVTSLVQVVIYNQLGQVVFREVYPADIERTRLELNLETYDNGIYFIEMIQDKQFVTTKIVKQ